MWSLPGIIHLVGMLITSFDSHFFLVVRCWIYQPEFLMLSFVGFIQVFARYMMDNPSEIWYLNFLKLGRVARFAGKCCYYLIESF